MPWLESIFPSHLHSPEVWPNLRKLGAFDGVRSRAAPTDPLNIVDFGVIPTRTAFLEKTVGTFFLALHLTPSFGQVPRTIILQLW